LTKKIQYLVRVFISKIFIDQRFGTFLIFLAIAGVFWLLNTLGKTYETELSYSVDYIDPPEDKQISNQLPGKLNLKIKGRGFTLLKYKLDIGTKPVPINMSKRIQRNQNNDSLNAFIISSELKPLFVKHFKEDVQLIQISPDTLHVNMTNIITNKVPVHVNINIDYDAQFMKADDFKVNPDSIYVSGPENKLDTIKNIQTQQIQLNNVNKSKQVTANLKSIQDVTFSTQNVTVYIPVERFTEATLSLPVQTINVPDSIDIKTFPTEIKLSLFVSFDDYQKVNPDDFKAYIDYQSIKENIGNYIPVYINDTSDYAKRIKYRPKRVEYIIEKN
jgi:YbbR domain-containing protein